MQEIHVQSLIWEDALENGMALLSKNPLKYSYLGNPMDREALQATAHELQRSQMTWEYTGLHLMEAAATTTTMVYLEETQDAKHSILIKSISSDQRVICNSKLSMRYLGQSLANY